MLVGCIYIQKLYMRVYKYKSQVYKIYNYVIITI